MFKFIIPGYYLFYSRLKLKLEKISWFLIYIFPIYIIGAFYNLNNLLIYSSIFILSTVVFNAIYEIGYIENDIKTVLNEKNPTFRLSKEDYLFVKDNYTFIIYAKIFIAICLLYLIHILANIFSYNIYILQFIVLLIGIRFVFYLHNKIRSNINILTFFTLAILKYSAPLFLILSKTELLEVWLMTLFLFPLLRTMEHATKNKYKMKKWSTFIGNHDTFRIKYYIFILIISNIYFFYLNKISLLVLFLIIYFLIYRIASYVLVKNNLFNRNKKLYEEKIC